MVERLGAPLGAVEEDLLFVDKVEQEQLMPAPSRHRQAVVVEVEEGLHPLALIIWGAQAVAVG